MKKRNLIFAKSTLAALFVFVVVSFAQTPRRAEPPAPVTRANAPQFIVIGSDDNTNAQCITWMHGVLDRGTNRDGSKRYMSFYVNTGWNSAVKNAVIGAYNAGHSISNHTHGHIRCVGGSGDNYHNFSMRMSEQAIYNDIIRARDSMVAAGIPIAHQFGFRTPFLSYGNETFAAMRRAGILYDCSINSSLTTVPGNDSWPYTLDIIPGQQTLDPNGNIAWDNAWFSGNQRNFWGSGNPISEHRGLWVLPATSIQVPPADRAGHTGFDHVGNGLITGLDWNIWNSLRPGLDSAKTVRALMHTLRQSLAGNRAPFLYGVHSQMYPENSWQRRSFEEFVRQASQLEDVFFVTGDMVVHWMKNPVPASQFKPEDYFRGKTGVITPPNTGPFIELIGRQGLEWESYRDAFGTGSDVTSLAATSTSMTANISLGTTVGTNYPYVGITTNPNVNFAQLTGLEITYTANRALRIGILLRDPASNTTASYPIELAAAPSGTTVSLQLSQFVRPSWVPPGFNGPANIDAANNNNITGISFFSETVGIVNLTVTSIKLYGAEWNSGPTSIAAHKTIPSKNLNNVAATIANGQINLSFPTSASSANIALFDLRGRLLFEQNIAVNGNFANVALPKSITANQAAVLQVRTNSGLNMAKRVFVK